MTDYIRGVTEIGVVIGVTLYLSAAGREAYFLGRKMFFENLVGQQMKKAVKRIILLIVFFSSLKRLPHHQGFSF